MDYAMSKFKVESYLSQLSDEGRAFLDNTPLWFDAAWAIGVWASVAGSLFLLLRSRHAAAAFAVSLAGLLVSMIYYVWLARSPMLAEAGITAWVFTLAIPVVLVGLLIYARRMAAKDVLR
jgi:hypothetical protein